MDPYATVGNGLPEGNKLAEFTWGEVFSELPIRDLGNRRCAAWCQIENHCVFASNTVWATKARDIDLSNID